MPSTFLLLVCSIAILQPVSELPATGSFDAPRMATERGESSGVRPAKRDAPAVVAVDIG